MSYLNELNYVYVEIRKTIENNLDKIKDYYKTVNESLDLYNKNINERQDIFNFLDLFKENNETFKFFYSDDINDGFYFKFAESNKPLYYWFGCYGIQDETIGCYSFYDTDIIELVKFTKLVLEEYLNEK